MPMGGIALYNCTICTLEYFADNFAEELDTGGIIGDNLQDADNRNLGGIIISRDPDTPPPMDRVEEEGHSCQDSGGLVRGL